MVKKIIYLFIVVFLLANFCWGGKPIWKYVVPVAEDVAGGSDSKLEKAKEMLKKGVKGSEKALEKAKKSIKDGASNISETLKNAPDAAISEKDRKDLKDLIKKNTNKDKK